MGRGVGRMPPTDAEGRGTGRRETGGRGGGADTGGPYSSQPSPRAGGGRGCGTSVGNPRCARIFRMTEGSSMVAMSCIRPPHRGQARTSDRMLTATILSAQLHCAPSASGSVDCWDTQKGGAPVLKVEANLFGGYDPTAERRQARAVREEGEPGRRSAASWRTDNTGELPIHAVRDLSGWRHASTAPSPTWRLSGSTSTSGRRPCLRSSASRASPLSNSAGSSRASRSK